MDLPPFDDYGECERCRKTRPLARTGICKKCLEYLVAIRGDDYFRKKELKRIAQAENGAIRFARWLGLSRTAQPERETKSGLEKQARREEQRELTELKRIIETPAEKLTRERAKAPYIPQIVAVTDELLAKLREQPEFLYEIEPRKFEEIIAELMSRIGFEDVELTKATRDGGRDVLAKLRVPTGMLYVITECKRYAAHRAVGLPIVERFLFTIAQRDNATFGMVATTSFFSRDVKATAEKYKSRLHLAGMEQIKGWLGNAGSWHQTKEGNLWVPPTV
jgi:restriction endonuclease Mrr